ncbi:MAG: hypothetical protein JM58_04200 [Peptococcaceae bacterium BICA1-8]|nr:MAG: hypothetical protein JM58_04200 [Peptococcaceae bacterium BICA1-8]
MQVKVVFHGSYQSVSNIREKQVKLPEKASLYDLIEILEEEYGRKLTGQLIDYENTEVWSLMAIAVNGKILNKLEKFYIELKDNDDIIFLPPAIGG